MISLLGRCICSGSDLADSFPGRSEHEAGAEQFLVSRAPITCGWEGSSLPPRLVPRPTDKVAVRAMPWRSGQ